MKTIRHDILLTIISILIIIFVGLYITKNRERQFKNNSCYAIIDSFELFNDQDGIKSIKYSFTIEMIKYSGIIYLPENIDKDKILGFKVKYVCNNPKINEVEFSR